MYGMIDHSAKIEAIRQKYSLRHHFSEEALFEAATLWGGSPNPCSVLPSEREMLFKNGLCSAEISFAETSKGYWLIGVSASTSMGGFGYAPSVWDSFGYASRHEARQAGIEQLLHFFQKEDGNRPDIRMVLRVLESEKTPQLSLF